MLILSVDALNITSTMGGSGSCRCGINKISRIMGGTEVDSVSTFIKDVTIYINSITVGGQNICLLEIPL